MKSAKLSVMQGHLLGEVMHYVDLLHAQSINLDGNGNHLCRLRSSATGLRQVQRGLRQHYDCSFTSNSVSSTFLAL
jgi:hypothetical protein